MRNLALLKAFAMSGGDWVIHILILCSILSIGIIIERAVVFRRRKAAVRLPDDFMSAWRSGKLGEAASVLAGRPMERDFASALAEAARQGVDLRDAAAENLVQERRLLEARLIVLNTLGNNAPFIGLLGTVLGVIRAFHDMAFTSGAGPEVVMQGLSEALVATAVGILVALPCVIAYNVFHKSVEDRVADAELLGNRLASAAGRGKA